MPHRLCSAPRVIHKIAALITTLIFFNTLALGTHVGNFEMALCKLFIVLLHNQQVALQGLNLAFEEGYFKLLLVKNFVLLIHRMLEILIIDLAIWTFLFYKLVELL